MSLQARSFTCVSFVSWSYKLLDKHIDANCLLFDGYCFCFTSLDVFHRYASVRAIKKICCGWSAMAHVLGVVFIYHSIRAHLCSSTQMVKTTNFLHKCTFHHNFSFMCTFHLTLISLLLTISSLVLHFIVHCYSALSWFDW